jgi:hypothetical protein
MKMPTTCPRCRGPAWVRFSTLCAAVRRETALWRVPASGVAVGGQSICHRLTFSGRGRQLKRSQRSRFAWLAATPFMALRLPLGVPMKNPAAAGFRWYSQREYRQELGWLPVSVLAGVGSGVVHTNCGYLRLCMPRCMHKLGVTARVGWTVHDCSDPSTPSLLLR